MPRFFVDVAENDSKTEDKEGRELPSLDQAKASAFHTLGQIVRFDCFREPRHDVVAIIKDSASKPLMRIVVSISIETLEEPPPGRTP